MMEIIKNNQMKKLLNRKTTEKKLSAKWRRIVKQELGCLQGYLRESITSEDTLLQNAALGLIDAGGKRLRPALAYLAARLWKARVEDLLPLLAALELIHTGSLVHDDIIDEASLRRGQPTVSCVYGDASALYVGDYLIGRAMELIAVYQEERLDLSLNRTVLQMCLGELRQERDFFRQEQCYRDYFNRIRRKTALLFAGSCECGAILAKAPDGDVDSLWRWGYNLGMSFQIIDDMLDLVADEKTLGKPTGNDLRQGNLSLAVLYALRQKDGAAAVLAQYIEALRQGDEAVLPRALELVRQSGGLCFAAETANRFLQNCEREQCRWPDTAGYIRQALDEVIQEFRLQMQGLVESV